MTKWEYLNIELNLKNGPLVRQLNSYGIDGWEVVHLSFGVIWAESWVDAIFKCRIKKDKE